jgi:hypothetical protein
MNLNELEAKIDTGLSKLIELDPVLIKNKTREESISHRLAYYLQGLFPDFDVDCEYDKFGEGDKGIRPDILIHKRMIQENNELAIEVKKGKYPSPSDKKKLKDLTDPNERYRYNYGLFIGFIINGDSIVPKKRWFKNGAEIPPLK